MSISHPQRNPCLNGGMCYSMWDDFTCTCPPRTTGRRCEEVRWCELSPCPADSECRMLNQGYECKWHLRFQQLPDPSRPCLKVETSEVQVKSKTFMGKLKVKLQVSKPCSPTTGIKMQHFNISLSNLC